MEKTQQAKSLYNFRVCEFIWKMPHLDNSNERCSIQCNFAFKNEIKY